MSQPIDSAGNGNAPFDPFAGPAIALSVASTEAQREIWTATQMGRDGSLAFNEAVRLRLLGALDAAALRDALTQLIARHESLHATFSPDGLMMLVVDPAPLAMPMQDLSAHTPAQRVRELETVLRQVVSDEFDLEHGPLLRGTLVRLDAAEHELVLSAHHIVCDGWSWGVIASELAALYTARLTGTAAVLSPIERFTDFAREEALAAAAPARADDQRYWLQQFSGALPELDLPGDRARPALKSYVAGREDHLIQSDVVRAVRAAGAKAGSSMFATLLSGFATLMYRLSGQDDLVIGVPSAGQSATGHEGLIGHCVNMLPMRIRADATAAADVLLAQVRTTSLDAFEHQALGFGKLLELLPIRRDPARLPLVSVIFNLDRTMPASAMPFEGLRPELLSVPRVCENFDLFVNAVAGDAGITLECQYNSDLFDAATVRRWMGNYEQLLASFAATPQMAIGKLAILTDTDRAALARCNQTELDVPADLLVHEMVEAQALRTPAATAVEFNGASVSYAALNARANQIAHVLRQRGAGRGSLVGLCLDRTPDLLVGLLAILKSGAGYVPLDPNYPQDRLSFMASDAALKVLLTDSRIADELSLSASSVLCLDSDAALVAAQPTTALERDALTAGSEDTAYVIYTSGSTGTPKGVLVPHRAVVNLLASVQREPGMTAADTMLAITTLSFDIAVSELLLPLSVGARIVLASRETASDGSMLQQLIERRGVTFIDATPATYRLLLAAGWRGNQALRLICTGEAMPKDLAQTLTTCAREVWNGYGPTETTVWSTFARVTAPVERVLIGYPVANTRIQILDTAGQQVPVGVAGEMFIGGRGVTRGYLNRPELTAERFIADPDVAGQLLYRTGDLVRLLPTGELECLGRTDNQVKVRGFRIEPGEVENVLMRARGVEAAVVIAREDRVNDVRLVAYIVAASDDVISDELRAFARDALPEFMVPHTYVRLTALPLTPSGKIDRKALPAPQATVAAAEHDFVAPRTESERIMASIWSDVLGLGQVSVRDDFFALGGHSLLASQVLSRLRRDYRVQLSFRKIFEAPTIEALARLMDAARQGGAPLAPAAVELIPPRADRSTAALSVLQERLWLLEELEPTQRAAHAHSAAWMLRGSLDVPRLERAVQALVMRHEALRTRFVKVDGVRRQLIELSGSVVLSQHDLSHLDPAAQTSALDEFFRAQQSTAFDLDRAPLFRVAVLRLSPDTHLLYTLQHGMVWDGWSFDLFVRDVTELYAADEQQRAPVLPSLAISYGDFASWQSVWLASPEAAQQSDWWTAQLSGDLDEIQLPTDRPRPEMSTHAGDLSTLEFSLDETEQLRTLARRFDTTLFMVAFAAYNVVLHRYTGQTDLLVGSPVRARTRPELEELIGPFVNTVMLRTQIEPARPFSDLLRSVRDVTLDSFSNQELPFELLGARVPPVRALFSMQDARERASTMGSVALEPYHVPQSYATNDLMLWMMESRTTLVAMLNFSTELFDRATADAFLAQLREILMAVRDNPELPVSAIDLSTSQERAQHMASFAPVTVTESVPNRVRQHANATPTRIAVRDGRRSMTFDELVTAADRISGGLTQHGVRAGEVVAIAVDDTLDRVTTILGVLGTGAGVALLDGADPASFRQSVLRAIGAKVLVCDPVGDEESAGGEWSGLTFDALQRSEAAAAGSLAASGDVAVRVWLPGPEDSIDVASISHATLAAQAQSLADELELDDSDVAMATLPIATPAAVLEMLMPLARGATLLLASDDAREDGADLADEMTRSGATIASATDALWRGVMKTDWAPPSRFRAVVFTGTVLSVAELRQLASRASAAYTVFGMVPHGGATAVHRVSAEDAWCSTGAPLAGARFDIVDATGRSLPVGIPGFLRVAEDVVVQYAPRSDGVRARRHADGRVQLMHDDTAVLWPEGTPCGAASVESALRTEPTISDVAVVTRRDLAGTPRVVAYVVANGSSRAADAELRTAVRTRLPRRCIPNRIVQLDALPRTAEGSVRHVALVSPFAPASSVERKTPPRSEQEKLLVDIVQDVLGTERVAIQDNFFRLGGTSLLCFRVVERVRTTTGQTLSPRALLVGTLEQAAAELALQPAVAHRSRDDDGRGVFGRLKGFISGSVG